MGKILELAEKLWQGQTDTYTYHPFAPPYGTEAIAEQTWFNKGFANTIIRKTDQGLVMVDPGGFMDSRTKFNSVRKKIPDPVHTFIFTHGHVDHVFGVPLYQQEAAAKGWPSPLVVAHEAVVDRFRRYSLTRGWNGIINGRQFLGQVDHKVWPEHYFMPHITYARRLTLNIGGLEVHLRHGRGETDDHTWVYFPDTGVVCTGDLFIYAVPNAGNPQKVQRYAGPWAAALREMAALEPQVLAPGHGLPIMGRDRVRQALLDTAAVLESLEQQTLALMNQGATLDEIIHGVSLPPPLLEKPYLKPVYDEPEFIVRNIYRLYGGWYDGTPSHLKPAPEKIQAREIVRLAGGAEKVAARAQELLAQGDVRLACHLADWACLAAPGNKNIKRMASQIYLARFQQEKSTMARGIYMAAARKLGLELSQGQPLFPVQIRRDSERAPDQGKPRQAGPGSNDS